MKKNKTLGKTKIKLVYLYYAIIILLFVIGITFSNYISTTTSETQIKASKFSFKVGTTSGDEEITIDLEDTIINEEEGKVIPGSEGKIDLEIDFSDMEVATDYTITVDTDNTTIPSNLKLYTDSKYTTEFNSFSGTAKLDDATKTQTKTIYWKWNFTTEDETKNTTTTTDWMGEDIILTLKINVEQM